MQGQPFVVLILSPLRGDGDLFAPGQVVAGERVRVVGYVLGAALGDDPATMDAGTGANINHVVGQADGFLVMLHHQHGITQVTQASESAEEALVVALVQTNGGFVQHVHDAHQSGTNLTGQTNTLGLAAGQGFRAALQGQVFQPHVDQKLQAVADFLENLVGDFALAAGQVQVAEIAVGLAHRQSYHFR